MRSMRIGGGLIFFLIGLFLIWLPLYADGPQGTKMKLGQAGLMASGSEKPAVYPTMPGPGKKVSLPGGFYLIYGFDKKPKLGTVIVKVEIFSKDGKKDTSFVVKGDSGMPSMRGHHDMGEQPFQLSKKGDYLLPINIVMPGDWEIRLTFIKDGKVQFQGSYQFDV
jgi:hypothetical protein